MGSVLMALDGMNEREKLRMKKIAEVKATSIHGVCQMYGFGETTVERALRRGALPFSRVGRRIVIRIADVEKWIGESRSPKTIR